MICPANPGHFYIKTLYFNIYVNKYILMIKYIYSTPNK